MNTNQFNLFCINLVTKNEGKMLYEVFSQNKDNVVLSLEKMYFNVQYFYTDLQISTLSVIKFQSGNMCIWGGDTEGGEWVALKEPEYKDIV